MFCFIPHLSQCRPSLTHSWRAERVFNSIHQWSEKEESLTHGEFAAISEIFENVKERRRNKLKLSDRWLFGTSFRSQVDKHFYFHVERVWVWLSLSRDWREKEKTKEKQRTKLIERLSVSTYVTVRKYNSGPVRPADIITTTFEMSGKSWLNIFTVLCWRLPWEIFRVNATNRPQ